MEKFRLRSEYVKLTLSVVLAVFGMVLLIVGFIVPPLGVIDNSILVAFGEISTFAGAILGINYAYSTKMKELEYSVKKGVNNEKK